MRAWLYIIFCLLTLSCSEVVTPEKFTVNNIEFAMQMVDENSSSDTPYPISEGTKMGLFVNEIIYEDGQVKNLSVMRNREYINNGGVIKGDTVYLNKKKNYRIWSYAPFSNRILEGGAKIEFSHNRDIVWAYTNYPISGGSALLNRVDLEFKHLTSQVQFELIDNRDEYTSNKYPFDLRSFEVTGFSAKNFLILNEGRVERGETVDSIKINSEITPVCFVASGGICRYFVKVVIPGRQPYVMDSLVVNSVIDYNFLPGHSYYLKLNVNSEELTIKSDIVDWVVVDADDLIINPNNR